MKKPKPTVSRERKTTKIRSKINEIEIRNTVERMNKTKRFFFLEKINNIDKSLSRVTKERTQSQK